EEFSKYGVSWFEEPVSSDDVAGLHLLRNRGPAGMDITAGEYGWNMTHFRGLLAAEAVDCLQADVTRCGGITGRCGWLPYAMPKTSPSPPIAHLKLVRMR